MTELIGRKELVDVLKSTSARIKKIFDKDSKVIQNWIKLVESGTLNSFIYTDKNWYVGVPKQDGTLILQNIQHYDFEEEINKHFEAYPDLYNQNLPSNAVVNTYYFELLATTPGFLNENNYNSELVAACLAYVANKATIVADPADGNLGELKHFQI